MIAISDHTSKYFTVQTFSRVPRPPSPPPTVKTPIQQNPFALSNPSHSCPRASQPPPRRPYPARQPFQLFRRVSPILLLNGGRVRRCELDNPTLRSMNALDKCYQVEEKGWRGKRCIHNQRFLGECTYVRLGYVHKVSRYRIRSELPAGGRHCPKNVDRDQRKREAAQYKC
ncbi:hypothetical protein X777_05300 [Ooceraea biroi]|uniref:Uncharacterized protein n=1 Tax=Ooceraea biroi TaxID=2015173 RepID=A0A026WGF2_OOCBI|nr:hypothetical protein X777_05300 [Ooceraea biroi]